MTSPCSIIVIDDHEVVAKGCRQAFDEDALPWTVSWAPGLSSMERPAGPAVAVLDLRLGDGTTPVDNLRRLEELEVPAVAYTSAESPILVRQAIAGGALAIVRKSAPVAELIEAIMNAREGRPSAGLDWAAALDADEDFVSAHLNQTEASVLAAYASGQKSGAIARAQNLSIHTVNTYIAKIRAKYRSAGRPADTRVDLFKRVAEDGLVSYYDW